MKKITTALGQTFVLPVAHEFVASRSVYLVQSCMNPKSMGVGYATYVMHFFSESACL